MDKYSEKRVLIFASLVEVVTGLIVLIDPSLLARLLFAAEIGEVGIIITRIAGAGLFGLGVACWPGPLFAKQISKTLLGMLTYNFIVTFYFGYLGIVGKWVGPLLWPVIVLHVILTFLLSFGLFSSKQPRI